MKKLNEKTEYEIENNRLGFYEVKKLKKNSKVVDLNNLGDVIFNFGSVSKNALIRLFSNDVTYSLNKMLYNGEVKALLVTSSSNQGGDTVYFYDEFDKESQIKAELESYFTYYLSENNIKYGNLTVNPKNKSLSLPFIIEKEDKTFKFETEVFALKSYELKTFDFESSFDKMPVFVVDEVFTAEKIMAKPLNCIILIVDNTGRETEIRGIYKEPSTKEEKGGAKVFSSSNLNKYNAKYASEMSVEHTINKFKKPYLEAEKRSEALKERRINSKKAL